MTGARFPASARYSLLHGVRTGSGAHPAYYPMGTGGGGGLFPEIKRHRSETDHSLPSSAEVKNVGAIPWTTLLLRYAQVGCADKIRSSFVYVRLSDTYSNTVF
jgi:hypothetical protein